MKFKEHIDQKKQDMKQYILYDSISVKFKNRENKVVDCK